jgi:hypothetical protein
MSVRLPLEPLRSRKFLRVEEEGGKWARGRWDHWARCLRHAGQHLRRRKWPPVSRCWQVRHTVLAMESCSRAEVRLDRSLEMPWTGVHIAVRQVGGEQSVHAVAAAAAAAAVGVYDLSQSTDGSTSDAAG